MKQLVLNFIKRIGLLAVVNFKRTWVGVVQSRHVCLTVVIQVVDKFFRIESARTHARQQEDEHQ